MKKATDRVNHRRCESLDRRSIVYGDTENTKPQVGLNRVHRSDTLGSKSIRYQPFPVDAYMTHITALETRLSELQTECRTIQQKLNEWKKYILSLQAYLGEEYHLGSNLPLLGQPPASGSLIAGKQYFEEKSQYFEENRACSGDPKDSAARVDKYQFRYQRVDNSSSPPAPFDSSTGSKCIGTSRNRKRMPSLHDAKKHIRKNDSYCRDFPAGNTISWCTSDSENSLNPKWHLKQIESIVENESKCRNIRTKTKMDHCGSMQSQSQIKLSVRDGESPEEIVQQSSFSESNNSSTSYGFEARFKKSAPKPSNVPCLDIRPGQLSQWLTGVRTQGDTYASQEYVSAEQT